MNAPGGRVVPCRILYDVPALFICHLKCRLLNRHVTAVRLQMAVQFIAAKLNAGLQPHEACSQLLDHCLASDPKDACGVGCDNMTSVVVALQPSAKSG
jgi:hypothetical protein